MLEAWKVLDALIGLGYRVVNFDENGYLCMAPLEGHSPLSVVTLPYGQALLDSEVVRIVLQDIIAHGLIDWDEFLGTVT
jgi:hypothetical protein